MFFDRGNSANDTYDNADEKFADESSNSLLSTLEKESPSNKGDSTNTQIQSDEDDNFAGCQISFTMPTNGGAIKRKYSGQNRGFVNSVRQGARKKR